MQNLPDRNPNSPSAQTRAEVRPSHRGPQIFFLYVAAAIAAFTAVAYELLLASYATFLLGASVFQYSLVISFMMASMGLGALLTSKMKTNALQTFFLVEIGLAFTAAVALPLLYYAFAHDLSPRLLLMFFVLIIGLSIGMEIPLLSHISGSEKGLPRILFFDYLGGFAGGMAFPLWLLPKLGFFRVAAVLGTLNSVLAILMLWIFASELRAHRKWWVALVVVTFVLALTFLLFADPLRHLMELKLFEIRQASE